MKKIVSVALMCLIITSMVCVAVYADVSPGPSPESGDGVPEGNPGVRTDAPGLGGAPNSGDGIPDGSGF